MPVFDAAALGALSFRLDELAAAAPDCQARRCLVRLIFAAAALSAALAALACLTGA